VIFGGLLLFWKRKIVWIHLPCAFWGAFVEFSGKICPLTPLEIWFRIRSGTSGYKGGFIEHYILPVLYPAGLTRNVQIVLGSIVIIINVFIYWRVFISKHKRKMNKEKQNKRHNI
jgi:hypothetical protein